MNQSQLSDDVILIYAKRDIDRVSIPSNVKILGCNSFSHCILLESVTFAIGPNETYSIEEINNEAFDSCLKLQSIIIPSSVKLIKENAFRNCSKLKAVQFEGNHASSLTTIGASAFQTCQELEQISIPPSVEIIEIKAFFQCIKLKSVVFEQNQDNLWSLKKIGNYAFSECSALYTICIPSTLENLGIGSFSRCKELKWIKFSYGIKYLKEIPELAFNTCMKLKKITIPECVSTINAKAFQNSGLQYVYFMTDTYGNSGIEQLCSEAFLNCNHLVSIQVPKTMKIIERNCFKDCRKLAYLEIQGSHTTIKDDAFFSCKNLLCVSAPHMQASKFQLNRFAKLKQPIFFLSS